MSSNRREFLKQTTAAAAILTIPGSHLFPALNPRGWAEPAPEDLLMDALNAAKEAGAGGRSVRNGDAVARIVHYRGLLGRRAFVFTFWLSGDGRVAHLRFSPA